MQIVVREPKQTWLSQSSIKMCPYYNFPSILRDSICAHLHTFFIINFLYLLPFYYQFWKFWFNISISFLKSQNLVFLNLHLLFFVCLTIEALGVAKPSVASYLSQEILVEQEANRVHGLPGQPLVKFNNMVVISLSMKLKEEHCSIGFLRPLTN